MPRTRFNNGILGPRQTTSATAAAGLFGLVEHQVLTGASLFPRSRIPLVDGVYSYNFSIQGIRLPTTTVLNLGNFFTVDFWARPGTSQTLYSTIADSTTNNTGIWIGNSINNGGTAGRMNFFMSGGGTLVSTTAINDNTWRFFRLVRSGSSAYLFVNGILEASTSAWTGITAALSFSDGQIGRSRFGTGVALDNYFSGLISQFRIIIGVALSTSDFAIPTQVSPVTAETRIFTAADNQIVDRSSFNHNLTAAGAFPTITTVNVPAITL